MQGITTIRRFKCPFGLCTIIILVFAYCCNTLCQLGVITFSAKDTTATIASGHNAEHHHGELQTGEPEHHDHSRHHEAENDSGGCCDEMTERLNSSPVDISSGYEGLVKAEVNKLLTIFLLPELKLIPIFNKDNFLTRFDHQPNGPPDHPGQYLHILYSSFLI